MKKMDEIMELLTEEIEGFNRSIVKLQELTKKWDNLKIKGRCFQYRILHKRILKASGEGGRDLWKEF